MLSKAKQKAHRHHQPISGELLVPLADFVATKYGTLMAPGLSSILPPDQVVVSFATKLSGRQRAWLKSMRVADLTALQLTTVVKQLAINAVDAAVPMAIAKAVFQAVLAKKAVHNATHAEKLFAQALDEARKEIRSMIDELRPHMPGARHAAILAHYLV